MELFCPEDGRHLTFSDEDDDASELFFFPNNSLPSQEENEYIETLVSKEATFSSSTHSSLSGDHLHRERFESVQWILKMKTCFNFSFQTAYLAVTFLDRFLLRRNIDEGKKWAMKLLSIACLSLAAKMEESTPPFLSEYQFEGYRFRTKVMQRMELLVLDELEWRLNTVTPFDYFGFFALKFHLQSSSRKLLSQAIGFIFVLLEAMNLIDFRPSTIAAAAIIAASGEKPTQKLFESKIFAATLTESSERDRIFTCYNAMILKSQRERTRFQKISVLLDVSSNSDNLQNFNDFIDIECLSATSNKRRRLQPAHVQ